jgi:hypothetical protein
VSFNFTMFLCPSICPSVCLNKISASTGRIYMKLYIAIFFPVSTRSKIYCVLVILHAAGRQVDQPRCSLIIIYKFNVTWFIYLSLSGPTTAVAVFRNPNTIPFCLTTDLLLNVLFPWLLVHLPSTFFLDVLFFFFPSVSTP